jgi:hypothetical protein
MKLNFLDGFSKNAQMYSLMKILLSGAELFHANRRTNMTKQRVAFRSYVDSPKHKYFTLSFILILSLHAGYSEIPLVRLIKLLSSL